MLGILSTGSPALTLTSWLFILFMTIPFIGRTLCTFPSVITFTSHRLFKNCKMNFRSVHTLFPPFFSHHQESQNYLHKHSVKDTMALCKHNRVRLLFFPISSFSLCFSIMHLTLLECPSPYYIIFIPTSGFCGLRKYLSPKSLFFILSLFPFNRALYIFLFF